MGAVLNLLMWSMPSGGMGIFGLNWLQTYVRTRGARVRTAPIPITPPPPPPAGDFLLAEDGSRMLTEDGRPILLE